MIASVLAAPPAHRGAARSLAPLQWPRDAHGWPNAHTSHFTEAGGVHWHVQRAGSGPALLLLHGTGSATHSWRRLLPLLARHFTVLAPDLPGHAFSSPMALPHGALRDFAAALAQLLRAERLAPVVGVGHSAGAALLLQMIVDGSIAPASVVSLNGALLPVRGMPGPVSSLVAQVFARTSLVPNWVARRARDRAAIERVIRGTGSALPEEDLQRYQRLAATPAHIANTLAMVASWRLAPLAEHYPQLDLPVHLLVAEGDRAVTPGEAARALRQFRRGTLLPLPHAGHLAHEEIPEAVAAHIVRIAHDAGVLPC